MKMTKTLMAAVCTFAFAGVLSFQIADPGSELDPDAAPEFAQNYEQQNPIAIKYWVQKLADSLPDGRNIIMRIQYLDTTMRDSINIYYAGARWYTTFRDKGTAPDLVANDGIYAAYLKENIDDFLATVALYESNLNNAGHTVKFRGHIGEMMETLPQFNVTAFLDNQEVEFDPLSINGADCDDELLRQNSLFITHEDVVEDGARTYNPTTGQGNQYGEWTFGALMENAANFTFTGITGGEFIKKWLKLWLTTPVVNGQSVSPRTEILKYVIYPWLKKCDAGVSNNDVSLNTWEATWDDIATNDYGDLIKYAPFKLTAIVNRLDLRGNGSYASTLTNAGETRFIFTLIPAVNNGTGVVAGEVPRHDNQGGTFVDWEGMNLIMEYGNVQTTWCDLKDFAQEWLDLSELTLGDPTYNDALAAITSTVTAFGAGGTGRPNRSALLRIRTNERLFQPVQGNDWESNDWQFRQFEIDATSHLLKQVPLTNTPVTATNFAHNFKLGGTDGWPYYNSTHAGRLMDWIFSLSYVGKTRLIRGLHNMPATINSNAFLEAAADVKGEYAHHWGLDFGTSTTYFNHNNYPNISYDTMRVQVSLNTCQGCHAGETKTLFTHVRPMKYGEDAQYWTSPPATFNPPSYYNGMNYQFVSNKNKNVVNGGTPRNNLDPQALGHFVKVSPFLTGVNYKESSSYDDDIDNPTENASDAGMNGLYYVADPTNSSALPADFDAPTSLVWGYNDLLKRKQDLCKFVNMKCVVEAEELHDMDISVVIEIIYGTSFDTAPFGSH